MSFLANSRNRTILQIVLAALIIVLGVILVEVIRSPARDFAREMAITETSRERMIQLRRALIAHEREYVGYPRTLDSLEYIIRNDSFFVARRDSIFQVQEDEVLRIDSLFNAARGPRFEYYAAFDDSLEVWTYMLRNPATTDSIGTTDPERANALRNVASWE